MSFLLQFKVCPTSLCDGVVITDLTGQESCLSAIGFGAPNIALGDVTTATIKVATRNSDGTFSSDTTINAFPTLPSQTGGTFSITNVLYPGGFGDAIYRFIYTITGVSSNIPFTYSATIYRPITCSLTCCWQKLSKKLCECDCSDELKDKHRRLSVLMRGLSATCDCASLDCMQDIINEGTEICADCGCGCS